MVQLSSNHPAYLRPYAAKLAKALASALRREPSEPLQRAFSAALASCLRLAPAGASYVRKVVAGMVEHYRESRSTAARPVPLQCCALYGQCPYCVVLYIDSVLIV